MMRKNGQGNNQNRVLPVVVEVREAYHTETVTDTSDCELRMLYLIILIIGAIAILFLGPTSNDINPSLTGEKFNDTNTKATIAVVHVRTVSDARLQVAEIQGVREFFSVFKKIKSA